MKCSNQHIIRPQYNDNNDIIHIENKYYTSFVVNCGKCYECLQNRAFQWNYRLTVESRHSKDYLNKYFVTFTYSKEYISVDKETGRYTLNHRPIQDAIKRLRYYEKMDGNKSHIRYYCVGEYGGKFKRPHHHIIFFNIKNKDNFRRMWLPVGREETTDKNQILPKEEILTNGDIRYIYTCNKHGVIGRTTVDTLNEGTMQYTVNYCVKPRWTNRPKTVKREYIAVSLGIGHQILYDDNFVDGFRHNPTNRFLVTEKGYRMPLPRYYYNKIFSPEERRLLLIEYLWTAKIECNVNNLLKNASNSKLIKKGQTRYLE